MRRVVFVSSPFVSVDLSLTLLLTFLYLGAMFAGSDIEGGFVELGKRKKVEDVDDQLQQGIWD